MFVIALQVLRVFLATALGWFLCRRLGLLPSLATGLLCAALSSLCGYWLLMQTAINEVSWKNHLAGWLIPWGYSIAPSGLAMIATISALVWSALIGFGAFVAMKTGQLVSDAPATSTTPISSVLLLTTWVIYGTAFLYLLNQFSKNWDASRPPGSTIAIAMGVLGIILLTSLCFRFFGFPGTSLSIAGGPLLIGGILYGAFVLITVLAGSSSQWN